MLGLDFGTPEGPRRPARGEPPGHPGPVDPAADELCRLALPAAGGGGRAQARATAAPADLDRWFRAQTHAGSPARYADVWNAAGGDPAAVAASSAILDQHCADLERDPGEIRRSVQFRVSADTVDQAAATAKSYVEVGITDFLLIVSGPDPVAIAEGADHPTASPPRPRIGVHARVRFAAAQPRARTRALIRRLMW